MPPRKRLGQLLTELGVVDEDQVQSALGHQKQWGGKLGTILVQKGFCKEEQMVAALSQHLGISTVKLSEQKIDPRAVKTVSRQVAEKLHVFAYELSGSGRSEVITVAMSDPTDLSAVDQLAFHTGKRIRPMLCGDSELLFAIQANYPEEKPAAEQPAAATTPIARSTATLNPTATANTTTTPAASAAAGPAFPKRFQPLPSGAAALQPQRSGGPYIPPPVLQKAPPLPAAPVAPAPIEEIQPTETDGVPATLAPPRGGTGGEEIEEPIPLDDADLAADAPLEGLEPIAAHSQEPGHEIAGVENVAGEGQPSDEVRGLVPAGASADELPQDAIIGAAEPAWPPVEDAAPAAHGGEPGFAEVVAEVPPPEETTMEFGRAAAGTPAAEQGAPEFAEPVAEMPAAEQGEPQLAASPPAAGGAATVAAQAEAAAQEFAEAEAPDAWADVTDPLAGAAPAPSVAEAPSQEAVASPQSSAPVEEIRAAAEESRQADDRRAGAGDAFPWVSAPSPESAAPAVAAAPARAAFDGPASGELGQYAEPPEPDLGERTVRFGEPEAGAPSAADSFTADHAAGATSALSPADIETLGTLGIDPADGAAALRVLAAMVRVLGRRQPFDLEQLAAEIREAASRR